MLLKHIVIRATHRSDSSSHPQHSVPFLLFFSAVFLVGLHGASIIKVLAILSTNFAITRACGSWKYGPILTWTFNIAILFSNEWNDGYRFDSLHHALGFLVCCIAACGAEMYVANIFTRCGCGQIGYTGGCLSSMACQFQYHHAAASLVQYGPLLGTHSP